LGALPVAAVVLLMVFAGRAPQRRPSRHRRLRIPAGLSAVPSPAMKPSSSLTAMLSPPLRREPGQHVDAGVGDEVGRELPFPARTFLIETSNWAKTGSVSVKTGASDSSRRRTRSRLARSARRVRLDPRDPQRVARGRYHGRERADERERRDSREQLRTDVGRYDVADRDRPGPRTAPCARTPRAAASRPCRCETSPRERGTFAKVRLYSACSDRRARPRVSGRARTEQHALRPHRSERAVGRRRVEHAALELPSAARESDDDPRRQA
jgi:hypothetical protein